MSAEPVITDDGRRLRFGDGEAFAALWLFDHAAEARDPVSGQRGGGALELDPALTLRAAERAGEALRLEFSSGAVRHVRLADLGAAPAGPARALWPTPDALAVEPVDASAYLADDRALQAALAQAARFGLAFLSGAGSDPDALERIVARFGFIRETNYGRMFTVRAKPQPENLAFTDRALELHTDNPYRDPCPTLQLLHVVEADDAGGGESLFVDGFAHAEALRARDPEAFALLASQPVGFAYAEASGARLQMRAPVLELDADGAVRAVRVNHRSLVAPALPAERMEAWYAAYLDYVRALHAPDAAYARRLAAGDVVLFDNRRVLHGRRAVLGRPGGRWLQGCYADRDGLMATLARLDA
jgi:alpha-ketoglutarate-dependent taurine dioxygenase